MPTSVCDTRSAGNYHCDKAIAESMYVYIHLSRNWKDMLMQRKDFVFEFYSGFHLFQYDLSIPRCLFCLLIRGVCVDSAHLSFDCFAIDLCS